MTHFQERWRELVGDRKRKPRRDSREVREARAQEVRARVLEERMRAAANRLERVMGWA